MFRTTGLRRLAPLVLLLCAPGLPGPASGASAQPSDPELTARIQVLLEGFGGEAGVYVRHLGTGVSAAIHADEVFPTASLVKVPLLLALYDQVDRGILDLHGPLPYPDTLNYSPGGVVSYMEPGETLPLSQLAFLMLALSDNHASLWIQGLLGGGEVVNTWMAEHGFQHTRVNSRTPGRADAQAEYGWGQTSPREIAETLVMLREGRAVSPEASEEMYRMLSRSYWMYQALSQIPPTVQAASKQGFVSRSKAEVLLVNAPTGDYVLAVLTKNQTEAGSDWDNEGYRLIRDVSRSVYTYFNPEDPWEPGDRRTP